MIQRLCDFLLSGISILTLSILLIPTIIILKFTGEGKILFSQERIGLGGKKFKLYKFATMLSNSPNLLTGTLTVKNDPRILPVGRLLRTTKINELPQLFNVFIGDMSLIGPRPLTLQSFGAYSHNVQSLIKKVRPGLSGMGSIIFRHEEDILTSSVDPIKFYNEVIAPYKGEVESWYVQNNGIVVYFMAIITTVWVVFVPGSSIVWRAFPTLPIPPYELKIRLCF